MKIEFFRPSSCSLICHGANLWMQVVEESGESVQVEIQSTEPIHGYLLGDTQKRERILNFVRRDFRPEFVRLFVRDTLDTITLLIKANQLIKFYIKGEYFINREK